METEIKIKQEYKIECLKIIAEIDNKLLSIRYDIEGIYEDDNVTTREKDIDRLELRQKVIADKFAKINKLIKEDCEN